MFRWYQSRRNSNLYSSGYNYRIVIDIRLLAKLFLIIQLKLKQY